MQSAQIAQHSKLVALVFFAVLLSTSPGAPAAYAQGQRDPQVRAAEGGSKVEVTNVVAGDSSGSFDAHLTLDSSDEPTGFVVLAVDFATGKAHWVPLTTSAATNRGLVRKLLAEAGLVRGPDEDALAQPGRVSDRAIDRVAERGATLLRLPALEGGPPICEQCEFVCSGGANVSVEILDPPGYLLATTTNLTNYENRDTPYGCDWWMTGVPSCVAESPTGFGTNWYMQSCSHAGPSGTIDGWSHQVTGHYWNRDFATPARTDAVVNLTVSGPSGGYPPLQVTKSLSAWGEFWYLLQLSVIYWNNFYDDCYS